MTADLKAIADACRAYLAIYDDPSVEQPEPSAFGPAITRLLWVLDGKPEDRLVAVPILPPVAELLAAAEAIQDGLDHGHAFIPRKRLRAAIEAVRMAHEVKP